MDRMQITDLYRRIDRRARTAFIATFAIGLLTHFYKFVNTLWIHDSIRNIYNDQNILASGRWLLGLACAPSSYFDLPWVTGLFSLLWISLTAVIVVTLFDVRDEASVLLICGVSAVFPSVTELFFFQFTADGYMLAMLLAALSVYMTRMGQKRVLPWIGAAVCLACTCGIYQAYVSFALALTLCHFAVRLLKADAEEKTSAFVKWGLLQAALYAVSMVLYYVVWKICMAVQHTQPTDYQGINQMGLPSVGGCITSAKTAVVQLLDFFLNNLLSGYRRVSFWLILNGAFLAFFVVIVIVACLKSKIYRRPVRLALLAVSLCMIPAAIFIWVFVSTHVDYTGSRMKQSISVLYAFAVVLAAAYLRPLWRRAFSLLLTCVIFFFGVTANILYFNLDKVWDKSYATGIEIVTRIHEVDDGAARYLVIVGDNQNGLRPNYYEPQQLGIFVGKTINSLLIDEKNSLDYLANIYDLQLQYYLQHPDEEPNYVASQTGKGGTMNARFSRMEEEERAAFVTSDAVLAMPDWPAPDSVQVIGEAMVVKFSDEKPKDAAAENPDMQS